MGEFEAKENTRYVDVPCLKKRRRALVFLADFFLTLMLTITLFHLAIYPLSRVIVNYDSRIESLHQTQAERDSVLYDLELLFPKAEGRTTYDAFEDNLAYTSEEYIHYLVDNAHGSEYEVFATYFKGVKGSATAYVSFYRELDENQGFFDFDNNEIHLKEEYVQSLSPKYNPDDTMSTKGISDYERLEGRIFVQGYQRMLSDAYSNDLSHNGISYKTSQDKISGILNAHPINRWCRMNVQVKTDVNQNIQPDKRNNNPANRIDGFMAELDAYVTLLDYQDEYMQMVTSTWRG